MFRPQWAVVPEPLYKGLEKIVCGYLDETCLLFLLFSETGCHYRAQPDLLLPLEGQSKGHQARTSANMVPGLSLDLNQCGTRVSAVISSRLSWFQGLGSEVALD